MSDTWRPEYVGMKFSKENDEGNSLDLHNAELWQQARDEAINDCVQIVTQAALYVPQQAALIRALWELKTQRPSGKPSRPKFERTFGE